MSYTGFSGVGLCLPRRGDDPVAIPPRTATFHLSLREFHLLRLLSPELMRPGGGDAPRKPTVLQAMCALAAALFMAWADVATLITGTARIPRMSLADPPANI